MILYHGTDTAGAARIRAEGVIRAGRYYGGITGVALTPRHDVAAEFAADDFDPEIEGEVFAVEVPLSALVVDPESCNHDDVEQALREGVSVYYTGDLTL